MYYGWDGVHAALKNEMSADMFFRLLLSARKLNNLREVERMADMRNAVVTALSKRGARKMRDLIRERVRGADNG